MQNLLIRFFFVAVALLVLRPVLAETLLTYEPDGMPPVVLMKDGEPLRVPIESPKLPPDPNTQGRLTLAGVDSDGDGVRDDVERYIAYRFPTAPQIRLPLYQTAKAVGQMILTGGNGDEQASAAMKALLDASACVSEIPGLSASEQERYETNVVAKMLNTYERSLEFARNSQNGLYLTKTISGVCE